MLKVPGLARAYAQRLGGNSSIWFELAQVRSASASIGRSRINNFAVQQSAGFGGIDTPNTPQTQFLDLRGLMELLRVELPDHPQVGAPIDHNVVNRVSEILQRTRLNPKEWQQHAVFRRGRYTRSIVGYSPNQFIALLLCWERGQQSPIHDHAGAHCFMKLLSGELREERFRWTETGGSEGEACENTYLSATTASQSVAFAHDELGLHRISNPSADEVAVSLHIYSPPFSQCQIFPPTGARPKIAPMVSVSTPWPSEPATPKGKDWSQTTSFREFISSASQFQKDEDGHLDAFEILGAVEKIKFCPEEWSMYAGPSHFSEFHCVQHLLHYDDDFSVIVSCWGPGQGVPRHTVGTGRQTWVKVMHGSLRFQEFAPGSFPWEVEVDRETTLPEGSSSVLQQCASKMHCFVNESTEEPAVSIHVFSPPLTQFIFQTEKGVERRCVPALLGSLGTVASVPGGPPAAAPSLRGLERTAGFHYLSLYDLATLLDQELANGSPTDGAVMALLRKAVFNPEEWRTVLANSMWAQQESSYSMTPDGTKSAEPSPRYLILAQRSQYTLIMWLWGHGSHGATVTSRAPATSRCWTRVLEGELEERVLADGESLKSECPRVLRVSTLKEDSTTFLGCGGVVQRHCGAGHTCVSLDLYMPPLVDFEVSSQNRSSTSEKTPQ